MKSLSIIVAILLTAAMNLAYSGDALDGIDRKSAPIEILKLKAQDCGIVCTRPGTSLHPEECKCIHEEYRAKDGTESLINDSSMHYIGSKITKNGSEVTIYKDGNGNFMAINPDNEPPNHYKKSRTLEEILEFAKMDEKEDLTDHYGKDDQTFRERTPIKTPNIKMTEDRADHYQKDDRILREGTLTETPDIKMTSDNTIKFVQRNGVDKVYATVTKKGTGKKIKIYKTLHNDWIASDEDGNKVRYGSRNSLKHIVYDKEHHVGPISEADKYQIELDAWKRSEAARKSLESAQEVARNGRDDRILRERTPTETPDNTIKFVQRNGVDKVYATVTKKGTGKKIKIYKTLDNDWIASDEDGNKVRYGSRNSLKHIVYDKEHHVGPISEADKYQIELDAWKRSEAARKSLESAQERAES